jgi:hypothetical protein
LRPAAVIVMAAVLIGGLIRPAQFASKKTIAVATAPVSASDEATLDPAAPQAEVRTGAIDAAAPPPTSAVAAELNPGSMPSSEHTLGENMSSETPTDISTAGLRLSSAAVDEQAAGSEESKTAAPHAAPTVALDLIAPREPAVGKTQKDDDNVAREALSREYLQ